MTDRVRPQLSSFGTLLRSSTQLYSAKAPVLFLINFIVIAPLLLVVYLISVLLPQIRDVLTPTRVVVMRVIILALFSIFALAALVSTGALIIYIAKSLRGEAVTLLSAYQLTLKRLSEFLKVNLFYGLKVLAGSLLLLLPGIYFGIIHVFAPLMVLVDGSPVKEAMGRSREMIKPNLFAYTDYLLLTVLAALISCMPFLVILNYLIDWSMLNNYVRLAAVADFATMCLGLMVTQFILVFYVRFYEELRTHPS